MFAPQALFCASGAALAASFPDWHPGPMARVFVDGCSASTYLYLSKSASADDLRRRLAQRMHWAKMRIVHGMPEDSFVELAEKVGEKIYPPTIYERTDDDRQGELDWHEITAVSVKPEEINPPVDFSAMFDIEFLATVQDNPPPVTAVSGDDVLYAQSADPLDEVNGFVFDVSASVVPQPSCGKPAKPVIPPCVPIYKKDGQLLGPKKLNDEPFDLGDVEFEGEAEVNDGDDPELAAQFSWKQCSKEHVRMNRIAMSDLTATEVSMVNKERYQPFRMALHDHTLDRTRLNPRILPKVLRLGAKHFLVRPNVFNLSAVISAGLSGAYPPGCWIPPWPGSIFNRQPQVFPGLDQDRDDQAIAAFVGDRRLAGYSGHVPDRRDLIMETFRAAGSGLDEPAFYRAVLYYGMRAICGYEYSSPVGGSCPDFSGEWKGLPYPCDGTRVLSLQAMSVRQVERTLGACPDVEGDLPYPAFRHPLTPVSIKLENFDPVKVAEKRLLHEPATYAISSVVGSVPRDGVVVASPGGDQLNVLQSDRVIDAVAAFWASVSVSRSFPLEFMGAYFLYLKKMPEVVRRCKIDQFCTPAGMRRPYLSVIEVPKVPPGPQMSVVAYPGVSLPGFARIRVVTTSAAEALKHYPRSDAPYSLGECQAAWALATVAAAACSDRPIFYVEGLLKDAFHYAETDVPGLGPIVQSKRLMWSQSVDSFKRLVIGSATHRHREAEPYLERVCAYIASDGFQSTNNAILVSMMTPAIGKDGKEIPCGYSSLD